MGAASASWWRGTEALGRFVTDLACHELRRLRPGVSLASLPWPSSLSFDQGGLGLDSLELLALASALAETIHLAESGIEDYLLARRTIGDWIAIAAAGLERFDARLTFRTSGSTGEPKRCVHPLAALNQEIAAQADLFPATERVIAAVPSHHIYGFLFTILLPHHLGDLPVIDARSSSPARLAALLAEGDLVVGHPAFWDAVTRAVPRFPRGVTGVTSTAPCPADTAKAVIEGGLERLVQVYGSSETAGVAWRDAPDGAYALYPHWRRGEESGTVLRRVPENDHDEAYELPDTLDWTDDRHFRLAGRRDRAVQIGGINVFPERVRAVLCSHPAIEAATVRLMRPEEGQRLKAFVVPKPGIDPAMLGPALTNWIDEHLTTPERPRAVTFGTALPAGAMGKEADWPVFPERPQADSLLRTIEPAC